LDTKGMEGAVLFATSRSGVEELSKGLSKIGQPKDKLPAFQALLHVNLEKGYQVLDSQLLTVHPLKAANPPIANLPAAP
jgi:hypothetical protein